MIFLRIFIFFFFYMIIHYIALNLTILPFRLASEIHNLGLQSIIEGASL